MRVVSNTSPICNLAMIGRLELLHHRYGEVYIPGVVAQELEALRHPVARTAITAAVDAGWLKVNSTAIPQLQVRPPLDAGETAALALALVLKADVLLMDEKRGREAARQHGVVVAGVLGELLHARQHGSIPSLKDELGRLRREAGFFIEPSLEAFILSRAGE